MSRASQAQRDQQIYEAVCAIIAAESDGNTGSWFWVNISIGERFTIEESIARESAHRLQAFLRAGNESVPEAAKEWLQLLHEIQSESGWWKRQTLHLALNRAVARGIAEKRIRTTMTTDFRGRRNYTLSVQ